MDERAPEAPSAAGARSAEADGSGLVTYDITGRTHRMPGAGEVAEVMKLINGPEAAPETRYRLQISPGAVRLASRKPEPEQLTVERRRGQVTEWTRRSRRGMTLRLAETDYGPIADLGRTPAMVTLTYPRDWEVVAPTGQASKAHLKAWIRRYERRWQEKLIMVWKLEFQARGAPHYHVYMAPPVDPDFQSWLSESWAEVVNHPDRNERARHRAAGTAVDFAPGVGWSDPKRIAIYFTKHAAPKSASTKEYQHRVPDRWRQPGGHPGRFWGTTGLRRAVGGIEVTEREWVVLRRMLRRMSRTVISRGPDGKRTQLALKTATAPRYRRGKLTWRRQTRRLRRFKDGRMLGGFQLAADGPALALELVVAARVQVAEKDEGVAKRPLGLADRGNPV